MLKNMPDGKAVLFCHNVLGRRGGGGGGLQRVEELEQVGEPRWVVQLQQEKNQINTALAYRECTAKIMLQSIIALSCF